MLHNLVLYLISLRDNESHQHQFSNVNVPNSRTGSPGWVKSVASGCPECLSNGKDNWVVSQGRLLGGLGIDLQLQEFPYDQQILVFFFLGFIFAREDNIFALRYFSHPTEHSI